MTPVMVFVVMAIAFSRFADFLMRPALSGEQYCGFVFKGSFIFGDNRLDRDSLCFGTRLSKLTCRLHLLNLGDEDKAAIHIAMLRESHADQVDQQGDLNGEEGLKLIRFQSPVEA